MTADGGIIQPNDSLLLPLDYCVMTVGPKIFSLDWKHFDTHYFLLFVFNVNRPSEIHLIFSPLES